MMTMVSLCMAVVLLAGCDGDGRGPEDTLPPEETTTSSTAVSYEVPAVIDAAYVSRVMAALDHVYGDAVRHLAKTRHVDEEFLKYLVAIYNARSFTLMQDAWVKLEARGFPGLKTVPGDPVLTVDGLLQSSPTCVVIEGDHALSPLFDTDDATNHHRYVALVPREASRDPAGLNPTPWTINFDGQAPGGALPDDACTPQ